MLWLTLGTVALAAVVIVCCGALVEVFRQLSLLREAVNLEDSPQPLNFKARELSAVAAGFPNEVVREPEAIAVFLSAKCGTCLAIAEAFRGGAPETVWFVLPDPATPFADGLAEALVAAQDRIIYDSNNTIADRLGLQVTPAVLTIQFGEIVRAHTASSARQVMSLLPTVAPRGLAIRRGGRDGVPRLAAVDD
jgi:hypothetical protein